MQNNKNSKKLSKFLFWDTDIKKLNIEKNKKYIIKRIIEYGNIQMIKWMKENYSSEDIIEVIRNCRGLSRKSVYFWAYYYKIPFEEIKCLRKF